jgi:hypothetical protein
MSLHHGGVCESLCYRALSCSPCPPDASSNVTLLSSDGCAHASYDGGVETDDGALCDHGVYAHRRRQVNRWKTQWGCPDQSSSARRCATHRPAPQDCPVFGRLLVVNCPYPSNRSSSKCNCNYLGSLYCLLRLFYLNAFIKFQGNQAT